MAECSHNIDIKNLSEGEIIRHSILIIRGNVINIKSQSCTSELITLRYGTNILKEICKNNEFKFIVDLQTYESILKGEKVDLELHFEYCTKQFTLKLFLEKPKSFYRLQPIYILCSNEEETDLTKNHCEKINLNLRIVQSLFYDRIRAIGCTPTTFILNGACHTFKSNITKEKAWSSDENFLWNYFAEELLKNQYFGDGRNVRLKIVAFIGCTKYDGSAVISSNDISYSNIRKHLKAHAALGGKHLALFGSAFFYAWPARVDEIVGCFQNTRKVDPAIEPDDSNYRRNYLGVYSTTLGAVCHELGHIFDLGHTQNGIMGCGGGSFDFPNRLLTIAERTENLPKRIIGGVSTNIHVNKPTSESRLTKLNKNSIEFLDKYREQKFSECFYFTRECAVILVNNKWFRDISYQMPNDVSVKITFDFVQARVACDNQALKVIEIRSISDSIVEKHFEFSKCANDKEIFSFQLDPIELEERKFTHYLFVMTAEGESSRFDLFI